MTALEGLRLWKTSGGKLRNADTIKWAVLETSDDSISTSCYSALLDILTHHWRYILERQRGTPPKVPRYNFSASLLGKFERGLSLLSKDRWFRLAVAIWSSSYTRSDRLDAVLDCCSALEAVLRLHDELRLRISLAVYHTVEKNKRSSVASVYEMYGIRNDFIHGNRIPEVTQAQQETYVGIVAPVLYGCVKRGHTPDSERISRLIIQHYTGEGA